MSSSHIAPGRKRITVDVAPDLHEKLLDALYVAQQAGISVTKTDAIQLGMKLATETITDLLGLDDVPTRAGEVRVGRPAAEGDEDTIVIDFRGVQRPSEAAMLLGTDPFIRRRAFRLAELAGLDYDDASLLADEIQGTLMTYVDGR